MIDKHKIPNEVFFIFSNKCNMRCSFCYVPFNKRSFDNKIIHNIFNFLCSLPPRKIVISGGDPFLYEHILLMVKKLIDSGHKVHIDSNFKSAPKNLLDEIQEFHRNLTFGLPVDGSNDKVHSNMRGEKYHLSVVLSYLELLTASKFMCKVNTVVSKVNYYDMHGIEKLLSNFSISQWSLYQFWPMSEGLKNKEEFLLSEKRYLSVVRDIKKNSSLRIGGGSVNDRHDGYFFIRSDGSAYTVSEKNHRKYRELGVISGC